MIHRFIYVCFFTVSITGRRVAQKPEIHEDFPGNFTQVVGSEVLLECPIVVNDSFDPPEMLWIEVKLHTVRVPLYPALDRKPLLFTYKARFLRFEKVFCRTTGSTVANFGQMHLKLF